MKNKKILSLILLLSSACATLPGSVAPIKRMKEYVSSTTATAPRAFESVWDFLKVSGAVKWKNQPKKFADVSRLTLDHANRDLNEFQLHGMVTCYKDDQGGVLGTINSAVDDDQLSFQLVINVKDQKIRFAYTELQMTNRKGKPSVHDFNNSEDISKTIDPCLNPIHEQIVSYVNEGSLKDNW